MVLNKGNLALNSNLLLNITFSLFPISFIFGNLITNLNFLVFCCLGIFRLRSKILTNKLNLPLKIISLFFLLVLFSTILNFAESLYLGKYDKYDSTQLIKSILFLRFFLILLIIYLLSKFDIINYKFFFIFAAIFPVIISIDVIFQYIFGFNVIGIKGLERHNPSFFGDELISGGYIKNFAFFSIFFIINKLRNENTLSNIILLILTICILSTGIHLSGNRMPYVLFLFGLFLLFIFGKDLRKILLISYCIIYIIFQTLVSIDVNLRYAHGYFVNYASQAIVSISNQAVKLVSKNQEKKEKDTNSLSKNNKQVEQEIVEIKDDVLNRTGNSRLVHVKARDLEGTWETRLHEDPEEHGYKKLVFTGIEVWKKNKIFGNGIRSFRFECRKIINEQKRGLCSNHPHNYYVEILIDLGIVGAILTIGIAFLFIVFLLRNFKALKKEKSIENLFLLAAILSLFLEVFPLRSSGSIFTTNNTTYIILMSSIILCYSNLLARKNFR